MLKKIGAHIAIPAMITAWGTVCCLTGLVQNYHGLVAARLILGLCEAGLFPGTVLYLSMFCTLLRAFPRQTGQLTYEVLDQIDATSFKPASRSSSRRPPSQALSRVCWRQRLSNLTARAGKKDGGK